MGRYEFEVYNPDGAGSITAADLTGDGQTSGYGDHEVYYPDLISELRRPSEEALRYCSAAQHAFERHRKGQKSATITAAVARLMLYAEALKTTAIEGLPTTARALLEYRATERSTASWSCGLHEKAASDAVDALETYAMRPSAGTTLDDICRLNAMLTSTSYDPGACGSLRKDRVWIGGHTLLDARYVPPPASALEGYMEDFVRFMNDTSYAENPVLWAALAHLQLVTIHPFEDGNGRTGRVLASRLLRQANLFDGFVPPTSILLGLEHPKYIHALECGRSGDGPADPSEFIAFFARSCQYAARTAVGVEQRLGVLLCAWCERLMSLDEPKYRALGAFAALPLMTEHMLSERLGEDVAPILSELLACGIVEREASAIAGLDVFVAKDVLALLDDAMQLWGHPVMTG